MNTERSAVRLLVVDDEPDVREMMSALLGAEGYDVVTAPDGATALDSARRTSFDVAILDLRMPGLSGRETLAELRQVDPSVATIIVSGYVTPEEAQHCRALGAMAILHKPFGIDALLAAIRRALATCSRPGGWKTTSRRS